MEACPDHESGPWPRPGDVCGRTGGTRGSWLRRTQL